MKELINKLEKIIQYSTNDNVKQIITEAIQALTSVKSESVEEKKEFNADFLYDEIFNILNANRGNFTETNSILKSRIILKYAKDIHNAVISYKLNANADKKQHAIGFLLFCDANGWKWNQETLDFERFDGVQLLDASAEDLFDHYIDMQNEKNNND